MKPRALFESWESSKFHKAHPTDPIWKKQAAATYSQRGGNASQPSLRSGTADGFRSYNNSVSELPTIDSLNNGETIVNGRRDSRFNTGGSMRRSIVGGLDGSTFDSGAQTKIRELQLMLQRERAAHVRTEQVLLEDMENVKQQAVEQIKVIRARHLKLQTKTGQFPKSLMEPGDLRDEPDTPSDGFDAGFYREYEKVMLMFLTSKMAMVGMSDEAAKIDEFSYNDLALFGLANVLGDEDIGLKLGCCGPTLSRMEGLKQYRSELEEARLAELESQKPELVSLDEEQKQWEEEQAAEAAAAAAEAEAAANKGKSFDDSFAELEQASSKGRGGRSKKTWKGNSSWLPSVRKLEPIPGFRIDLVVAYDRMSMAMKTDGLRLFKALSSVYKATGPTASGVVLDLNNQNEIMTLIRKRCPKRVVERCEADFEEALELISCHTRQVCGFVSANMLRNKNITLLLLNAIKYDKAILVCQNPTGEVEMPERMPLKLVQLLAQKMVPFHRSHADYVSRKIKKRLKAISQQIAANPGKNRYATESSAKARRKALEEEVEDDDDGGEDGAEEEEGGAKKKEAGSTSLRTLGMQYHAYLCHKASSAAGVAEMMWRELKGEYIFAYEQGGKKNEQVGLTIGRSMNFVFLFSPGVLDCSVCMEQLFAALKLAKPVIFVRDIYDHSYDGISKYEEITQFPGLQELATSQHSPLTKNDVLRVIEQLKEGHADALMYSAEFFPSFCDQIKTKLGPCKQACDLVAEHCGTHVVAEFAKYQKLKRLDLYNKGLTTEEVLCITNGLMYQTSITALDLRKNEMDQESGGQAVINVLNRNQRIIELNGINIEGKSTIDCREMERQGFELFEASFLGNRMLQSATLTSVNLSWCSLRKNGTRMLANGLGECMKLRHIDLAGNYMGVIGAGLIANAIRQKQHLESIMLSDNMLVGIDRNSNGDYSCDGLKKLCEGLKVCPVIKEIDFSRNYIREIGCQYVSQLLRMANTLESVNLAHNQLGGQHSTGLSGLKVALKAIPYCQSLTSLDLSTNDFGNFGHYSEIAVQTIVKVIDHIKTPLTYLYLGGNHIARQHIEDLQNKLYTIHIMTQENGSAKSRDQTQQRAQDEKEDDKEEGADGSGAAAS